MADKTAQVTARSHMAQVVERNIHALLARQHREEEHQPMQQRVADAITRFTGSMTFVYLHAAIYGCWIVVNLGWIPSIPKFDPSFVVLAMVASVEAIFLSTFILISQNRMSTVADRRADLNLQISLLAEHEVTRLVELVSAMAKQMGIDAATDPQLDELKQDVHPETVLDTMDAIKAEEDGDSTAKP
jgi:uncharacterized membrane protein